MADSPVKEMSTRKKFMSMMEINFRFGGQDEANRWLAAHVGELYSQVEELKKEIRRLKRLVKKVT